MFTGFAASDFGSLGVEYESTVIDQVTSRPLPLAELISENAQPLYTRGAITPDLSQPTLEFTTGICRDIDQARSDLHSAYRAVRPILDEHQAELLGMGLSPSAHRDEFQPLPQARYQEIYSSLTWTAEQVTTNGIHVHIGMPSLNVALSTSRVLRSLLPLLLALSASSPFQHEKCTGLASTRMALWSAIPRSGPMPDFANEAEYLSYLMALRTAGAVRHQRDFRWDCRPNSTLGTLEIRIIETVADLDDAMALVALAWCMAVGVEHLEEFALPHTLSNENRWSAIRYGTDASMIVDTSGKTASLAHYTERVGEALGGTADLLGCRSEIERCIELGGGRAAHQILTENSGSLPQDRLARAAETSMRVHW